MHNDLQIHGGVHNEDLNFTVMNFYVSSLLVSRQPLQNQSRYNEQAMKKCVN
jgi:hypothetical protein